MKRFDPIPLVQAGGVQPFHGSTPQPPGAALLAMLRGSTFGGMNPMDAGRALQSGQGQSLLASLSSGYVSPPGGGGDWQLTPDQRDRNGEWSKRHWEQSHAPRRLRKRSFSHDDRDQNT